MRGDRLNLVIDCLQCCEQFVCLIISDREDQVSGSAVRNVDVVVVAAEHDAGQICCCDVNLDIACNILQCADCGVDAACELAVGQCLSSGSRSLLEDAQTGAAVLEHSIFCCEVVSIGCIQLGAEHRNCICLFCTLLDSCDGLLCVVVELAHLKSEIGDAVGCGDLCCRCLNDSSSLGVLLLSILQELVCSVGNAVLIGEGHSVADVLVIGVGHIDGDGALDNKACPVDLDLVAEVILELAAGMAHHVLDDDAEVLAAVCDVDRDHGLAVIDLDISLAAHCVCDCLCGLSICVAALFQSKLHCLLQCTCGCLGVDCAGTCDCENAGLEIIVPGGFADLDRRSDLLHGAVDDDLLRCNSILDGNIDDPCLVPFAGLFCVDIDHCRCSELGQGEDRTGRRSGRALEKCFHASKPLL